MAYRYTRVETGVAYDSTLNYPVFGPIKAYFDQVKDLQTFDTVIRIAPGAAQAQVSIAPVTTGYFLMILSDYPVQVAINGNSPQFILKSNNPPAVNVGSPLPPSCCLMLTGQVTSLYLTPITGAAQTANVTVLVTGDPTNSYT